MVGCLSRAMRVRPPSTMSSHIETHYDLCIRDDLTLGYVPGEDVSVFQYGSLEADLYVSGSR
jgi:hypothetical protein